MDSQDSRRDELIEIYQRMSTSELLQRYKSGSLTNFADNIAAEVLLSRGVHPRAMARQTQYEKSVAEAASWKPGFEWTEKKLIDKILALLTVGILVPVGVYVLFNGHLGWGLFLAISPFGVFLKFRD